ncbi:hypothetical protein BpHYR1_046602 [Brachionus plicatilis]|uniref:Uncharacterized protein n=1 Tax=Brachionus plicatilis TaxID=10195 RepID=A0A3M7S3E3_BRAPC|nr:hypothetical protein BpHYR1_046602 [Brachionus plicatilis]
MHLLDFLKIIGVSFAEKFSVFIFFANLKNKFKSKRKYLNQGFKNSFFEKNFLNNEFDMIAC